MFGDDGGASQLATVTGDVTSGYTVSLALGVDTGTTPTGGGLAGDGAPSGVPGWYPARRWSRRHPAERSAAGPAVELTREPSARPARVTGGSDRLHAGRVSGPRRRDGSVTAVALASAVAVLFRGSSLTVASGLG